MVARRTDARRRRVLSEEFIPTDEAVVSGNNKPMQAYSFGANRRNQPKTTDLIPKRATALTVFFLMISSCVAGLNMLAYNAASLRSVLGESGVRSVELSGVGTLANWLCSISLFLCAGICTQLYLLRQHKRDDYGGMYRVWLVMAAMFFVASIDCAIDLRSIAAKLFEHLTHRSLLQTPWLMLTIEMIVLATIVIRMLFEVRASRFSLATVVLVWLGFVGSIVLRHVQIPESLASVNQNLAYGNCVLLGCVGSLVALTVYTRFVFLHAHGLIEMKVRKTKPAAEPDQEDDTPPLKLNVPPSTKTKSTSSASGSKKSQTFTPEKQAPAAPPQPVVTRKAKPTPKPAAAKPETASKPVPVKSAKSPVAKPKIVSSTDKPAAASKKVAPAPTSTTVEEPDTSSMSKAERRRQRKLAKRAARDKKAA